MAKQNLLISQFRTLNPLAIALISFILGLLFPFKQSFGRNHLFCSLHSLQASYFAQAQLKNIVSAPDSNEVFTLMLKDLNKAKVKNIKTKPSPQLHSIPEQYKGKIIEDVNFNNKQKVVALTFDDGPWPETTNHILYVLKKHKIKATFFVLGKNAQNYPAYLKQIVLHGHAIGNHSWNHPYSYQNEAAAARQIENTAALINKLTGVKTSIFRPPGGFLNNGLVNYAKKKNYGIVMWSADSQDYRGSKKSILKNLLQKTKSGGILLMHDGGGDRWNTLVALPYLIIELKKQGYEFVTVPELLKIKAQELENNTN